MVTDGVRKLGPAQSFSDKSVKIKGNKNVEMCMLLTYVLCMLAFRQNDKLQFELVPTTKILIHGISL